MDCPLGLVGPLVGGMVWNEEFVAGKEVTSPLAVELAVLEFVDELIGRDSEARIVEELDALPEVSLALVVSPELLVGLVAGVEELVNGIGVSPPGSE